MRLHPNALGLLPPVQSDQISVGRLVVSDFGAKDCYPLAELFQLIRHPSPFPALEDVSLEPIAIEAGRVSTSGERPTRARIKLPLVAPLLFLQGGDGVLSRLSGKLCIDFCQKTFKSSNSPKSNRP